MPTDCADYTVAWICALEIEYLVACELLDEEYTKLESPRIDHAKDPNIYTFGRISQHNVVLACLPKGSYGISSAAVVAERMRATFSSLQYRLLVGIAGGAPTIQNDIRLGDIVVSVPTAKHGGVLQYDYGKGVQGDDFNITGYMSRPPEDLLTALTHLGAWHKRRGHNIAKTINAMIARNPRLENCRRPLDTTDRLYISTCVHDDRADCDCSTIFRQRKAVDRRLVLRCDRPSSLSQPVIHYGLIASANTLMKDALTRDRLAYTHEILCFEMEAAGLMINFPAVTIRGICDYSDTHKNKLWQPFAAAAAAAYAKELLQIVPGSLCQLGLWTGELSSDLAAAEYAAVSDLKESGASQGGRSLSESVSLYEPRDALPAIPTTISKHSALSKPPQNMRRACFICKHEPFASSEALLQHVLNRHEVYRSVARFLYAQKQDLGSSGARIFRRSVLNHLGSGNELTWNGIVSLINAASREVGPLDFPELVQQEWLNTWRQTFSKQTNPTRRQRDRSTATSASRGSSPGTTLVESSTEVVEYNEDGNVIRRTISRTSSRSSMQSSQGEQETTDQHPPLPPLPPLPPFPDPLSLPKRSRSLSQIPAHKVRPKSDIVSALDEDFKNLRSFVHDIGGKERKTEFIRILTSLRVKVRETFLPSSEQAGVEGT